MSEDKKIEKSTILIADDNPMNLKVLTDLLNPDNFKISAVTNGRKVLEIVDKVTPDLILLDIMMPEMDGFEACEKLKEGEKTKDIPIIFLTAKIDSDDIVKGFELGAADYVTKPFKPAELMARVRTHLELKRSKEQQQKLIEELKESLENVKTLKGFVPICSYCKKIRDDSGFWNQLEEYIHNHSDMDFSHGVCPDCFKIHFPGIKGGHNE